MMRIHPHSPAERAAIQVAPRRRRERQAIGLLALGAVVLLAYIARSVAVGVVLGLLTAFLLEPLYRWLLLHVRPWIARGLCLLGAAVIVAAIVAGAVGIFVARGAAIITDLIADLTPGGKFRDELMRVARFLGPLGIHVGDVLDHLRNAATSIAGYAAAVATELARRTMAGALSYFFFLLTAHYALARGEQIEASVIAMAPLAPAHTRALLQELRTVGRATLLGTVVTGLAQGTLAGLIFLAVGLPYPLFFGVATAAASLIPSVGTFLVWAPVGVYLFVIGRPVRGVIELVLSATLVIGACDYYLRPRLVGRDSMSTLPTFVALFGGLATFGVVGLILGPLLVAMALAVLRLYRGERIRERRDLAAATH